MPGARKRLPTFGGFGSVCCAVQALRAELKGPPIYPLCVPEAQASVCAQQRRSEEELGGENCALRAQKFFPGHN